MRIAQETLLLLNAGKKQEYQKIESIFSEKTITGGLQAKRDHVVQILKCFMIQESQNVQRDAILHVDAENMWKYGITYSWNIIKTKMENTQN